MARHCKLPLAFYQTNNVLDISQQLLGKVLVTKINGNIITSGMITETEAYSGPEDMASHAYNNRRTTRTETMYLSGGVVYVYLCYGIHNLVNIVTGKANIPHAVLIRAIEPLEGLELMQERRKQNKLTYKLTSGPGALCQALGITTKLDRESLKGQKIWLEDRGIEIPSKNIAATTRIGVQYAKEHALLPWRFIIKDNHWISKKAE